MDVKKEILRTAPIEEVHISQKGYEPNVYIENKPLYAFFKRAFDIFASIIGIFVLSLPLFIVTLLIIFDNPAASPIYVQERIGKNGRKFMLYKFRSMIPNAEQMLEQLLEMNEMDGPAFKMKEDPRITRFGRFIRKTSIDELPQLLNILMGDMSFVGPRPPLPREVAMYTENQHKRLSVTPGLTCYWQIQPKRNSLSFDEWFALDIKYISERNFWTDVKILFKTVGAVFRLEGE